MVPNPWTLDEALRAAATLLKAPSAERIAPGRRALRAGLAGRALVAEAEALWPQHFERVTSILAARPVHE